MPGRLVLAPPPANRERDLMEKELLERQAAARDVRRLRVVGEVDRRQGVGASGQPMLGAQLGRQRFDRVADMP